MRLSLRILRYSMSLNYETGSPTTHQAVPALKLRFGGNGLVHQTLDLKWHNADLRRGDLTRKQRADYIRAVKCLQAKPPKAPAYLVPGARSRFDDFAGVHIHQTFDIHFNVRAAPMNDPSIKHDSCSAGCLLSVASLFRMEV